MSPRPRNAFGITGTPGTGKKSIAPLVARALSIPCLGLNGVAKDAGLLERGGEVDTAKLRKALARRLRTPAVVYGHLIPYSLDRRRVDRVAVLRCEPSVLRERLESRGYPAEKVLDNVQAELIGLVSADAVRAFGKAKAFEVDTTYTAPADAASDVVSIIRGERRGGVSIDWMPNYDTGPKLRSLLPSA